MSELVDLLAFGRAMWAAFSEYFSALDELLDPGGARSGSRYQAAYRRIFETAGRYFNRTLHGERIERR
ncbi:MAG: hypothetical protein ACKOC5_13585 [Chloroflexota bacterium]